MADPIRQLYSQTSWVANGTDTVWNFSFEGGYLDRAHVKAQRLSPTGGLTIIEVTPGMFVGPYQLQILPAVPAGHELTIFRDSLNGGLPLVDFSDRANLTEASLDLMAKQAIFVAAESADGLNVAVDSVSQIVQYTEAAIAAAAASQASAVASAASATQSATYRDQAATHATTSQTWANTASGHAANAATSAGQSAASAVAAAASAASIEGGPVTSVAGLTGVVGAGPLKTALSLSAVTNNVQVRRAGGNDIAMQWNVSGTGRVASYIDGAFTGDYATWADVVAMGNSKLNINGGVMVGPLYLRPSSGAGQFYVGASSTSEVAMVQFTEGAGGSYSSRWAFHMDTASNGRNFGLHRYATDGAYLGNIFIAENATGLIRFGKGVAGSVMTPTQDASLAAFNSITGNVGLTFLTEHGATAKTCYLTAGSDGQVIHWLIQNSAGGTYPQLASANGLLVTGAFDRRSGALNAVSGFFINGTWWLTVVAMSP